MDNRLEAISFIEDRINELKEAYDSMPDYEQVACNYVLEELKSLLSNLKVILEVE